MAITVPSPDYILPTEEPKDNKNKGKGVITGRGVTPATAAAQQQKYKNTNVAERVANSLEARQARSLTRLAEDTFIEATRKYKESPSTQTKAAYESAYKDFIKSTDAYKKLTNETYQTKKVPQDVVGKLPTESKGFDPRRQYTESGAAGASTPGDRAKIDGAPDYVFINPLDNSRWKSDGFLPLSDDPYSFSYASGTSQTELPVAFIANDNGSILQDSDGNPIDLGTSINNILKEYSSAGKMNELRDLLIRSKIAATPAEVAAMNNAKRMGNSDYFGQDPNTRALVQRAVQFLTISNIAAVGVKNNKPKFESFAQYLKGYKGDLNYLLGQSSGGGYGSGAPRKTISLSQQVYTPEDLELNIDAFFQEYTGQGASKEDVDYLVKRLNKQGTQKTVTTRDGNTEKSITTGGVSQGEQQLMMREMALNDPAAESYNKATTYLNYFREALESPIELG
jgi:hypothetical protein